MSETEDLIDLLRRAAEVVAQAEVPKELQPVAFGAAFDYLTRGRTAPFSGEQTNGVNAANASNESGDRLAVLARRLGVDREAAEYVYDPGETTLTLVIARSRLPGEKSAASRAIAILFAAGRQAAYGEEWTSVAAIRDECRSFGVLDSNNFAAAIKATADALIQRGKGAERAVKVTKTGFEEAGRLLRDLAP